MVDELRTYPTAMIKPAARRYGHVWFHLTSDADDDYAELHGFAAVIGLRREYFQGNHYDLAPNKRMQALMCGANFVPLTQQVLNRERAKVFAKFEIERDKLQIERLDRNKREVRARMAADLAKDFSKRI